MKFGEPPLPDNLGEAKLQISQRFSMCLHCEIMQPVFFRSESNCSLISFNGVGTVRGLSLTFYSVFSDSLPSDFFAKLAAPKFCKAVVALYNSHGMP